MKRKRSSVLQSEIVTSREVPARSSFPEKKETKTTRKKKKLRYDTLPVVVHSVRQYGRVTVSET